MKTTIHSNTSGNWMKIETEGRRKKGKRTLLLSSSYFDTFYKYTCRAASIYPDIFHLKNSRRAKRCPICANYHSYFIHVMTWDSCQCSLVCRLLWLSVISFFYTLWQKIHFLKRKKGSLYLLVWDKLPPVCLWNIFIILVSWDSECTLLSCSHRGLSVFLICALYPWNTSNWHKTVPHALTGETDRKQKMSIESRTHVSEILICVINGVTHLLLLHRYW